MKYIIALALFATVAYSFAKDKDNSKVIPVAKPDISFPLGFGNGFNLDSLNKKDWTIDWISSFTGSIDSTADISSKRDELRIVVNGNSFDVKRLFFRGLEKDRPLAMIQFYSGDIYQENRMSCKEVGEM